MKINKQKIAIAIILLFLLSFAFYLRFRMLDVKLFWADEFFTETRAFFSFKKIWLFYKTQRVLIFSLMMKLYSFIILPFNKTNYMTEYQLRFPNVIVGTVNVLLIYFIGKKIKNQVCGLIAATICAFSHFLIFYSREARFYPLLFAVSSILILFGGLIFSRKYDKEHELRIYAFYSFTAILGMYTHSGFWFLFALSNVLLVLNDFIYEFLFSKSGTIFQRIKNIAVKTFILATPLLFAIPLFLHLTQSDSERPVSNGMSMIKAFTYSTLNEYSVVYWKTSLFENYMFIIITAMAILLIFFSFFESSKKSGISKWELRLTVVFLYAIKILPFVVALLLPRNIVKEQILPKYILFVLICDLLIVSLFFSCFIDLCLRKLDAKKYLKIVISLCMFMILAFSFVKTNQLLKSDLYKPSTLVASVNMLKNFWQPGNFIVTDDLELWLWLNHAALAGIIPEGCFGSIDKIAKLDPSYISQGINGLILKTSGNVINIPNLIYLGNSGIGNVQTGSVGIGKFYFMKLNGDIDKNFLMGLISRLIISTPNYKYLNFNKTLASWRTKIKDERIDALIKSESSLKNIIKNGDFANGFTNWNYTSDFKLIRENDYNYIRMEKSSSEKWKYIRQQFLSISGEVYSISVDIRLTNLLKEQGETYISFAHINNKNELFNQKYFLISNKAFSTSWINFENTIESKHTGKSQLWVQYRRNSPVDIKNIRVTKRPSVNE